MSITITGAPTAVPCLVGAVSAPFTFIVKSDVAGEYRPAPNVLTVNSDRVRVATSSLGLSTAVWGQSLTIPSAIGDGGVVIHGQVRSIDADADTYDDLDTDHNLSLTLSGVFSLAQDGITSAETVNAAGTVSITSAATGAGTANAPSGNSYVNGVSTISCNGIANASASGTVAAISGATGNGSSSGYYLFDFESGTGGATLPTSDFVSYGSPQSLVYTPIGAIGTLSGKMTAAASGTSYAECVKTNTMTADTAEMRFALYTPNNYNRREILGSTGNLFWVALQNDGTIEITTERTATGYTTSGWTNIGTYASGWTYFRIVFNFTNDTYQMSMRTNEGSAWTQLKASGASVYDIPMRGTGNYTQTDKLRFSCSNGDVVMFDNIQAANAGIA